MVFDAIINNNKTDIKSLIAIRNIFYRNVDENEFNDYLFLEKKLTQSLIEDTQSKIVCNFLQNTLIKKMIDYLDNKQYNEIIDTYKIMIDSLKEKYTFSKIKCYTK